MKNLKVQQSLSMGGSRLKSGHFFLPHPPLYLGLLAYEEFFNHHVFAIFSHNIWIRPHLSDFDVLDIPSYSRYQAFFPPESSYTRSIEPNPEAPLLGGENRRKPASTWSCSYWGGCPCCWWRPGHCHTCQWPCWSCSCCTFCSRGGQREVPYFFIE